MRTNAEAHSKILQKLEQRAHRTELLFRNEYAATPLVHSASCDPPCLLHDALNRLIIVPCPPTPGFARWIAGGAVDKRRGRIFISKKQLCAVRTLFELL
jgi:hypothetical protein